VSGQSGAGSVNWESDMKTVFEYDAVSGEIKDANGLVIYMSGMVGFEPNKDSGGSVLELIKLGVTPDEIIKLSNNNLL